MTTAHPQLAANVQGIRARIAAAAARAGRAASDVRLIAVTKYVEPSLAQALIELGEHDLGESRPQELWRKVDLLGPLAAQVRWHFIGHLQRNKLDRTLAHTALLHSGDSLRLLTAINDFGQSHNRRIPTLIEVNISGDAAKHGFQPAELPALGETLDQLTHVEIRGLMGMSSLEGTADDARREFASLRQLRDQLQSVWPTSCALHELSMGMSDDFEAAIEEGSTCVRIGSALFEGLR
ncbi:MAG: YggS family pyridoxal phosphate-dependent enzyme [Planctomycetaceae bacterium]|nr:YggS family pyridoxal phosphate-dependent enzyme [Planctomycetaceae bacterium]